MLRHNFSITTKLAATFVLVALVPVIAVLLLIDRGNFNQVIRKTETHLVDLARDREELLENHLEAIVDSTATLAKSEIIQRFLGDLEAGQGPAPEDSDSLLIFARDLLHSAQEQTWGKTHHILLVDRSGRVVLSPENEQVESIGSDRAHWDASRQPTPFGHLGTSIASRDFFEEALTKPTITAFMRFTERDLFQQLVIHPVQRPGGETLGLVVAEVAIDEIDRLLTRALDLGDSSRFTLVTPAGQRIVHHPADGVEILDSEGMRKAIQSRGEVLGEYTLPDGREVFGIYRPSKNNQWVIGIEVDRDEVIGVWLAQRRFMLQMFGLTALALGLAGMLLGNWFGKPLRRCAAAARRVSEGDLKQPIPVSNGLDEIGILERATESMRVSLSEQIQTLDQRVEAKTDQLKSSLEEARRSQTRYALAVRGSKDGLWDWDLESNEIYYAPRWKELLGLGEDDPVETPDDWFNLISPDHQQDFQWLLMRHIDGETDQFDVEIEMLHADGKPRWMLCRAAATRDRAGKATRLAGSLADITALKNAQQELRRLANNDRLTGLPNKELFTERLQATIGRSKRNLEGEFAVLFFDFDRFKVINDSLGHNVGDALLISIADRFRSQLREVDTAARFGGDEFVVILDNVAGLEAAEEVCHRLLESFAKPHNLMGHEVVSTASIGLVMNEAVYDKAEEMIRDADAAMYQAKTGGRAQYRIFDKGMHSNAVQRLNLEHDLRHSDMDSEFRLFYQSIVNLETGEITGFEALIRWEHPTLGLVRPDEFIPIAEETGLIVPLGEWVLRTAARQLVEWQTQFGRRGDLIMNVNLARRQLLHPSLMGTLQDLKNEFDFEPGDLKLEITETTVMDERHDMLPAMEEIRSMGFPLAMDDFGTGHSSLSCLHCFPINVLKIDRSFISNLGESREFTAVVQAIVTLAHHLDLDVVAEGIETPEQLAQLQVLGCRYAQGYLFSKPIPAPQATQLLHTGIPKVA